MALRPVYIGLAGAFLTTAAAADPDENLTTLVDGFRAYHSVCNHCHGPDGLGSTFAPALVDTPPEPEAFLAAIRDGARGSQGVMKGFAENPEVMGRASAILAYIDARSRGMLGRGRPRP